MRGVLVIRRRTGALAGAPPIAASAPGSDGACPAVGDSAYVPGLTESRGCISLTIADRGPNDVDLSANGMIRDRATGRTTRVPA